LIRCKRPNGLPAGSVISFPMAQHAVSDGDGAKTQKDQAPKENLGSKNQRNKPQQYSDERVSPAAPGWRCLRRALCEDTGILLGWDVPRSRSLLVAWSSPFGKKAIAQRSWGSCACSIPGAAYYPSEIRRCDKTVRKYY